MYISVLLLFIYIFIYLCIYLCIYLFTIGRLKRQEAFCYTYKHNLLYFIIAIEIDLQRVSTTFSSTIVISGPLSIFQALCQYSKILVYICVSKIFSSTTFIQALCRYSKILVYTCVSTILALELLFQALRQYSNILAYTCVSTIFSSRTVIL